MQKYKNCVIYSIISVLLFTCFWVFLTLNSWTFGSVNHRLKGIGALAGVSGYCFFSLSLFLSSRWKKLEDWFGGLDQIYHTHHLIGIWGFCLLLIHPLILAIKWLPYRFDKFLLFFFPVHGRLSVNLGSYSFWLMIIILGITILKLLPYDKWKISHKFMNIVFILASLHFLLSDRIFGPKILTKALLFLPMLLGLFGLIYKQIFCKVIDYPRYEIINIKKLNSNILKIDLKPKKKKMSFIPGQYAFFSFKGPSLTSESHPFTICGGTNGSTISILSKARGDFTKSLYQHLKQGSSAIIEGPYGRFNYLNGKISQVWIAGGIGIVPFLIWARILYNSLDKQKKISLFYCVHNRLDAIYINEFKKISDKLPNFQFYFICSKNTGHLTANKILKVVGNLKETSIFMCGPKRLTKDFTKQFSKMGIKRKNIIYEDFEFF